MFVPFVRSSRFFRALVLTTAVFSFLVWLYIAFRVIVNGVDVHYPFVDSVRFISISAVGTFSFGGAFLSTFVYLWLWGRFRGMPLAPPTPPERPF